MRFRVFEKLRKKVSSYVTTVVAYFTTISQPFPIFRKLLATLNNSASKNIYQH